MAQQTSKWIRAGMFAALVAVAARPASAQTPAPAQPAPSSGVQNLNIFVGLDGSKQPQDLGINANMGARFSANWGFGLSQKDGLGGQVGIGVNLSDAAVHVLDQVEGTSSRKQLYVTAGVFQRTHNDKVTWAAAFDLLKEDYYNSFMLGQIRGQFGYQLNDRNEMGAWFTKDVMGDDGDLLGSPLRLDPISQIVGFSTQTWPTSARTSLWLGLVSGHDNVVATISNEPRSEWVAVYGAGLHMPLSDRFAIFGEGNFVTPTATGTVDAYLGVVFYPGGGASKRTPSRFSPVLAVANNPTFPVNLKLK